ncbi:MAG: SDR family oxidoreductase [Chitinophagaceae bacterium]|nr:SDR family oxidoreductase [Chitinophagaceae bacterium]
MANYLIIGASGGIGQALCEQLLQAGHHVWGTYNQHEMAAREGLHPLHLNVMEEDATWLTQLPEQIDGIAYCPGSIKLLPFGRIQTNDFKHDYELQVLGAIRILQALFPRLKKSNQASVVLFSTVAAQTGMPFHALVATHKAAIEGLTRSLAAEWAPSIRVNAIAPSLTDTPLASSLLNTDEKRHAAAQRHPLKRIGEPKDIAAMAAFLLQEQSRFITGQILAVDGGLSSLK